MKNILTACIICLCISAGKTQTKIDTIDFKTAVDRILADYPSKFQNIKAVDTCSTFCQLNFFIPGSYYPFCEVSRSFTKELNYGCTLTYSNYDFQQENSEKYRDYVDTDSITMVKFRAEIQNILLVALQNNFGKVTLTEENCDIKGDVEICEKLIFRTEHINTDHEFYEVTIRMVTELLKDGSTYWYNSLHFEKNKW